MPGKSGADVGRHFVAVTHSGLATSDRSARCAVPARLIGLFVIAHTK
jgi:hypothetical protein